MESVVWRCWWRGVSADPGAIYISPSRYSIYRLTPLHSCPGNISVKGFKVIGTGWITLLVFTTGDKKGLIGGGQPLHREVQPPGYREGQ